MEGETNKAIAAKLGVSEGTIERKLAGCREILKKDTSRSSYTTVTGQLSHNRLSGKGFRREPTLPCPVASQIAHRTRG